MGISKQKKLMRQKKDVQLISAEQTELLTVDKNAFIPFKHVFKTRLLPSIPLNQIKIIQAYFFFKI